MPSSFWASTTNSSSFSYLAGAGHHNVLVWGLSWEQQVDPTAYPSEPWGQFWQSAYSPILNTVTTDAKTDSSNGYPIGRALLAMSAVDYMTGNYTITADEAGRYIGGDPINVNHAAAWQLPLGLAIRAATIGVNCSI
jgi:hypothetical protein